MRPLELELVAFRSYDRATVDWRPHDLVVIAGDTGAGKSSLLDAISFALFGKTPELGRSTELLTLGHAHGEVRLTFALGDAHWRVTRRYGKDAPDPALLLERLDGDGGSVRDTYGDHVDDRLRELIGLSFEAFTSAVLLAQGRFAQFLAAAPRERDRILRELFGVRSLEAARQAALRRADGLRERAAGLRHAVSALPDHSPRRWWSTARSLRDAAAASAALRGLIPLAETIETLSADVAAAAERAAAAGALAAALPDADERERLRLAHSDAQTARAAALATQETAARDHDAAAAARDLVRLRHDGDAATLAGLAEVAAAVAARASAVPELRATETATRDALVAQEADLASAQATLTELAGAHEAARVELGRLEATRDRVRMRDRMQERLQELTTARDTAIAAHEQAAAAVSAAQGELDDALLHDRAIALRAELSAGDRCPVCGGTVGDHSPDTAVDLVATRQRLAAAQQRERDAARQRSDSAAAVDEAGRTLTDAAAELEGVEVPDEATIAAAAARRSAVDAERAAADGHLRVQTDRVGQTRGELRQIEARLQELDSALVADRARLGRWSAVPDAGAAIAAALAEVQVAEAGAADSAATLRAAEAELARTTESLHRIEQRLGADLRVSVATAIDRLGIDTPVARDLEELLTQAERVRAAASEVERSMTAESARRRALADGAAAEFATRATPLGVDGVAALPAAVAAREDASRTARERLRGIVDAAAAARGLVDQAAAADAASAVHGAVAKDLQANGFPRFVLGRFRERLASGASARLQELSAGAYRFAGREPDPLRVVDVRRGERPRSAATLSGGERFLASLSLALGLSDIAAESGGRLECLFLDEGFSTLDAESLEQALAGVERLAGDGRLIAVITHLPGWPAGWGRRSAWPGDPRARAAS
ncbi:MAG: SMC family ATPase [Thermoleophilia bacterium]